ncbi:tetratricopeptide repeat protein [Amycolatopsis sp. cmx-4-61]|uniref:tetratricopeptide repeat protein n=1 Tax=Amycolatopsis sp. cmx-4-61 TaxID=2790937 RepID=UPI003979763D
MTAHESTLPTQFDGRHVNGFPPEPGHHDALAVRHTLAVAHRDAGDLGRAVPLLEAVVTDYARVLGADHPDTVNCRRNLAATYKAAGDPARALPLFEAVLAHRVRALDADHPSALVSRSNLAAAYRDAGDPWRAVRLLEAALAGAERTSGGHTAPPRSASVARVRQARH